DSTGIGLSKMVYDVKDLRAACTVTSGWFSSAC
ncbi:hypothetical protein A2U01_0038113, partial [Trifolium medium]|nr:hypothetical protein [Trifolium medium]